MKAWLPSDPAESSRPKPGTRRGILEKFLRLFAEIGRSVNAITHFLRPRQPASQFTVEERDESALEQAGAIAAATENVVANLTTESFTVPITTGAKVDTDTQIDRVASTVLDQGEIQRRRDLVRTLFNDFWSGAHDKPASFVERLDQAEDYLNERLAETGEFWHLDAKTRVTLGLPPRANSSNN